MRTLSNFASDFRNQGVGQRLPKLHTPLVETRNPPKDTLDKNAMLVHRNQLTECFGSQRIEQHERRWPIPFKHAMGLVCGWGFASEQRLGLRNGVGEQQLVHVVVPTCGGLESHEVHRVNFSPLM